jgi:hypothetical protein
MKVTIIQYLLLLAFPIFPEDSNVESSNMASLESGYCLLLIRHRGNLKCSRLQNGITDVFPLYQNNPFDAKPASNDSARLSKNIAR